MNIAAHEGHQAANGPIERDSWRPSGTEVRPSQLANSMSQTSKRGGARPAGEVARAGDEGLCTRPPSELAGGVRQLSQLAGGVRQPPEFDSCASRACRCSVAQRCSVAPLQRCMQCKLGGVAAILQRCNESRTWGVRLKRRCAPLSLIVIERFIQGVWGGMVQRNVATKRLPWGGHERRAWHPACVCVKLMSAMQSILDAA